MLQEPRQADNRTYCNDLCKKIGICVDNDPNCRAYDPKMNEQWEREHLERCKELQRISDARIKIPLQVCNFAVRYVGEVVQINNYRCNYCDRYLAILCVFNSFYHFPESRASKLTYYEDDLSFPLRYLEQLGLAESEYDQIESVWAGAEEMKPHKTFVLAVRIKATGEVFHSLEGCVTCLGM